MLAIGGQYSYKQFLEYKKTVAAAGYDFAIGKVISEAQKNGQITLYFPDGKGGQSFIVLKQLKLPNKK